MTLRRPLDRLGRLGFPLVAPTWPESLPRAAPERRVGLDYDHAWSRRYPVRLARAVVLDNVAKPLARVAAPTTVVGLERLASLGRPLIFAADHTSHLDTPLLLTTLPPALRHRTAVAAAADHFFDRTWKSALWSFSLAAIPIERSRVNRRSADVAAELIEDGWSLIIFPEGGRSPDGWAQPFRGGVALLAQRTGRPVVPVHLHGTRGVLPRRTDPHPEAGSGTTGRRGRRPARTPVTVLFGPPLVPAEGENARRFSARIEAAVALLADEAATDWWQARRRAAAGSAPSPRGPDTAPWRRAWALGEPAAARTTSRRRWPPNRRGS